MYTSYLAKTTERDSPSYAIAAGGRHCFCALSQKPAPLYFHMFLQFTFTETIEVKLWM